jgi:glucose/mannose-6-phosphate isomerase
VIYASNRNYSIAYNWKIKFNETGKIPAFCNVFPELNHNEMTGFDIRDKLSENFHFIFLHDSADYERIQKRMYVTAEQLKERGFSVEHIDVQGISPLSKIFSSLVFADWASLYVAKQYGREPEDVPMIEELKKRLVEK